MKIIKIILIFFLLNNYCHAYLINSSNEKDDLITSSAITNAIEQIMTTDKAGLTDFFKETQKNVDVYEGMKQELANNPILAQQLQDPDLSPQEKEEMLKICKVQQINIQMNISLILTIQNIQNV